ncbi:MAG: sulfatase-like hydrolase/transferase [Rhodothermaceae bacterium]|nr:sulfatase-like hydrolase/transferase [Rhodothermaceae bacterium]
MMRLLLPHFLITISLCLSLSGKQTLPRSTSPPNVIIIIADQMRGDALGILDHPNINTPNLDRMAKEGVLFSDYFVNNPVCVPSRMSMFSGLYPHEHGALSNKGPTRRFSSADNTLLNYFDKKNYRLGWFGKDNHTYDRSVLDSLLDANTSLRREAFRAYSAHTPPHWASSSPWPKEELFAYKTTSDAINFISSQNADSSFFVVLSLFDPHPPYFAPADYVARYPINDIQVPAYINPETLSVRLNQHKEAMLFDLLSESDLKTTLAHYFAAIEWGVDFQVGRILDALETLDIKENTIVLFTSEHGDFMGEYGMVRKGMFLYDALLHVPFIWYGPGHLQQGILSEALVQSVDIVPTLIELTGGTPPSYAGRSLAGLLRGQGQLPDQERIIFASAGYQDIPADYFESPEAPYFSSNSEERPFHSRILDMQTTPVSRTIMARTNEWKLIVSETRAAELYQMRGGKSEEVNLANDPAYAEIQNQLTAAIQEEWPWGN